MKTIWFAAFSLVTIACSSSSASDDGASLSVETYTSGSSGAGVAVSSPVIPRKTQTVLVDGQLYNADAEGVAARIQASKRPRRRAS